VNETKRLMSVEKTTTRANSRMMFPTSPVTRLRGGTTTTSTSVIDSAAKPISFRPFQRRPPLVVPGFEVSVDVLEDDEWNRRRVFRQQATSPGAS